eukprot:CAMPEP_0113617974 /NCGR_PEP_ID=MMETSP0017_2-20120614/9083_1 /TAXON_ID=2856 /ORGANISM="Cylindrotheca closterium" /LENGTH=399 /DNA_ID=CAMNT_0000527439 /DNA_START=697 /DNA_END=1897 /DNA_ORIENTATION=+ /assembly_acc=CAM_ASM_000147
MTQTFENSDSANDDATTTKGIRQIQVIFLRHGEREDETEEYDKSQKTRQERVDPALTVLGHQQALGAWRKILTYVPNDKPIMIACSPLRRCIGTAMMVAAAASTSNAEDDGSLVPQFVLPTDNTNHQQEQTDNDNDDVDMSDDTETTIPMLVMNGLGDCAAQMRHMGGIGKAVKAGWLVCAASPGNDCLADPDDDAINSTPIQDSLRTIASNATNLQTRWGSSNVTQSCKLQFWRESKYHYFESSPLSDFSTMTEPRTLQDHSQPAAVMGDSRSGSTANSTHRDESSPLPMPKKCPSCDERFDQAVERAVLQTAHAGLDTCILVTHREAIRWIEGHWVDDFEQMGKHRLKRKLGPTRTYCCVGDYKVSLDLTDSKKPRVLSWETQKIVPWSELERDHHE